jgi:hypothetical protein
VNVVSDAITSAEALDVARKLDVVIPSYNRPGRLYELLKTGLDMAIPGVFFIVIDDGSTLSEEVPGLGLLSTEQVCASFATRNVVYIQNPQNMGVAESWQRYYRDFCSADYTMSVTDKDEFIDRQPIANALRKLDADPLLSMVILPLRQRDRSMEDRAMTFSYQRMSGKEFLARYVEDNMLQHCSMWGVMRVDAARAAGVPRSLNLRRYGLDDGFGIDIDFVFMVGTTGDVDFESEAHVRRSTLAGGTEKFPLTFAYTYYQYAKRAMRELRARGFVNRDTARRYLGLWILLISRGLLVAYRPVHGTELEPGTGRIRRHLFVPIHLYLLIECLRHGIKPTAEVVALYKKTLKIMISDWLKAMAVLRSR